MYIQQLFPHNPAALQGPLYARAVTQAWHIYWMWDGQRQRGSSSPAQPWSLCAGSDSLNALLAASSQGEGTDLLGHNGAVNSIDWSYDGVMALTASSDR
jgi:hypothetical protein